MSFRPDDPQMKSIVVFRDDLVCVVAPGHALAGANKVSIQRLGQESFTAHNVPSPLRQKVIQTFLRHKTPLQMEVELPSLEAIKPGLWSAGTGMALVIASADCGKQAGERGVGGGRGAGIAMWSASVRLVYRRQAALSHAARAFLKVVEEHAARVGDPFSFVVERA